MLLYKQRTLLVILLELGVAVLAIRVDTGKTPSVASSGGSEYSRGKEKFNPGPTQSGGWHKPESAVMYGDNAWQEADLSVFGSSKDEVSRLSEGHGLNFNDGSTSVKVGQIASFSSDNGQQYNGFSGSSLNSGGDLIVGQGSVQKPAGVQYQSHSSYSHGDTSFPVHAKIGADSSSYSQVVTTNSKVPLVNSASDYANRQQQQTSNVGVQVKPTQSQHYGKKPIQPSTQTFGHKINHPPNGQYPSKPAAVRPQPYYPKSPSKPAPPQYKPDSYHAPSGTRYSLQKPSHFPTTGSLRGGKPPAQAKFPIQPSYQFPKPNSPTKISRGGYAMGPF